MKGDTMKFAGQEVFTGDYTHDGKTYSICFLARSMKYAKEQAAQLGLSDVIRPAVMGELTPDGTLTEYVNANAIKDRVRVYLYMAACAVDDANAKRASAQVQDHCVRQDYEYAMGKALDQLRIAIDAYRSDMSSIEE